MTQIKTVCPNSVVELSWLVPDTNPALHYHVIVQDPGNNILLDSDTQASFGTLNVTAPSVPGHYIYTITVIRDDYGQLSDVTTLGLHVTRTALSDLHIIENPLMPGEPYTIYWTINAINPQSDELVHVIIDVPSNTLHEAPTHFEAYYPNATTGGTTFIAPDVMGKFPITVQGVGQFGCSDSQTLFLEVRGLVVHAGSDRVTVVVDNPKQNPIIKYFPTAVSLALFTYFGSFVLLVFWIFL